MEHVLITPETCNCDWRDDGPPCPICDGGLGQCKHCGAAEIELEDYPTCEEFEAKKKEIRP